MLRRKVGSLVAIVLILVNKHVFVEDKLDEEVCQDGVKVYIDKKAQLSLLGELKDQLSDRTKIF